MQTLSSAQARRRLREFADPARAAGQRMYFKNCDGDTFLGLRAAQVHGTAREFAALPLEEVAKLMHSSVHEERSLAHGVLRRQYETAKPAEQARIFRFYMKHRGAIRDWDGVDDSAPYIAGRYLLERDKRVLYRLVRSRSLWDRRIALVATLWFIRNGNVGDTLALCALVLEDREDLIHKAAGWMLREVGKRDGRALRAFLDEHAPRMPRTMLRYAIERFADAERRRYLALK